MKAYRHGEMILIPVPENLESQWQDLFQQAGRKMDNHRWACGVPAVKATKLSLRRC